ncbi:formate dehydrogenase subunit delta [Denitromonas iodatirespirans]|uniref:Formate dehydrogenase subunit delta n=1 Tax=Denitromonas iodatirespirans TaxID=2795389 RepID=A0A944DEA5_DENI1|nr:formate dehydrogenase subunit delta [Denitromonas iodatirespirans]MBT0963471.1 formate dehydrogenase subunit delta [Denitromonas iodatirespirans]
MEIQHLVKMANQIGQYFESYPDRDEACRCIAEHLGKFWAPRMRQALIAHLASPDGADTLTPLVAQAVRTLPAVQIPA